MDDPIDFGSAEKAVAFIRTRSDDIEKVVIYTTDVKSSLTGQLMHGVGMVIHLVSKEKIAVSRAIAEHLLNDGILNRLRVRIELGK